MTSMKIEKPNLPHDNVQKGIEMHRQAAMHHQQAAKFHVQAAAFHETGKTEECLVCTMKAYGQHMLAEECERENFKQYALGNIG
jgi:hypothetical protein